MPSGGLTRSPDNEGGIDVVEPARYCRDHGHRLEVVTRDVGSGPFVRLTWLVCPQLGCEYRWQLTH